MIIEFHLRDVFRLLSFARTGSSSCVGQILWHMNGLVRRNELAVLQPRYFEEFVREKLQNGGRTDWVDRHFRLGRLAQDFLHDNFANAVRLLSDLDSTDTSNSEEVLSADLSNAM